MGQLLSALWQYIPYHFLHRARDMLPGPSRSRQPSPPPISSPRPTRRASYTLLSTPSPLERPDPFDTLPSPPPERATSMEVERKEEPPALSLDTDIPLVEQAMLPLPELPEPMPPPPGPGTNDAVAEGYDGAAFDAENLSALEKIYLFSQSNAQFHRAYIARALPSILPEIAAFDAADYVLPLLSGLAMDEDEGVKEAFAVALGDVVWWFASHCRIVADEDEDAEGEPRLPVGTFTPIIGTLLLSTPPVGSATRAAVVDVLKRLKENVEVVGERERALLVDELLQQVVVGIGRLDVGDGEEDGQQGTEEELAEQAETAAVGRRSSMTLMAAVAAADLVPSEHYLDFVQEVTRVGSDPHFLVRKEAAFALGALAKVVPHESVTREFLPLFDALVQDEDWHVRHAALFALSALLARLDSQTRAALTLRTVPTLAQDPSAPVRIRTFECLGEVMYTFRDDPGGPPPELLALFLDTSDDSEPDNDNPLSVTVAARRLAASKNLLPTPSPTPPNDDGPRALICAFNLPAVALTLGPARWPELRSLHARLAAARASPVRRSLAAGSGALAGVLGPQIARADILPMWIASLRADEQGVRSKAIEAAPGLAAVLGRGEVVCALESAWDARALGWREREAALLGIRALLDAETDKGNENVRVGRDDEEQDEETLRRLARAALVDDTAAVRTAGVALLPAVVRALGTGPAGRALREDVAALAASGVFRQRMTFVACFKELASSNSAESVLDARLWDAIEPLVEDAIVDVRIGVARVAGMLSGKEPRAAALAACLREDADSGVRAFVRIDVPTSTATKVQARTALDEYPFATFSLPPPAPPPSEPEELLAEPEPEPEALEPAFEMPIQLPQPQPLRARTGSFTIAVPSRTDSPFRPQADGILRQRSDSPTGRRPESPLRRVDSPLRRADSPLRRAESPRIAHADSPLSHSSSSPLLHRTSSTTDSPRRRSLSRSPHSGSRRLLSLTPHRAESPAGQLSPPPLLSPPMFRGPSSPALEIPAPWSPSVAPGETVGWPEAVGWPIAGDATWPNLTPPLVVADRSSYGFEDAAASHSAEAAPSPACEATAPTVSLPPSRQSEEPEQLPPVIEHHAPPKLHTDKDERPALSSFASESTLSPTVPSSQSASSPVPSGSGSQRPVPPSEVLAREAAPTPANRPPLISQATARPASPGTVLAREVAPTPVQSVSSPVAAESSHSASSLDVNPPSSPRIPLTNAPVRPAPTPVPTQDSDSHNSTPSQSSTQSTSTTSSSAVSISTAASSVGSFASDPLPPVKEGGLQIPHAKGESGESDVTLVPGMGSADALATTPVGKALDVPMRASSLPQASPSSAPVRPHPIASGSSLSKISGLEAPVSPSKKRSGVPQLGDSPAAVSSRQTPLKGPASPARPAGGVSTLEADPSPQRPSVGASKEPWQKLAGGSQAEATVPVTPVTPTQERGPIFEHVLESPTSGRRLGS
ncbi:hypothetical protein PENSPDRAFT_689918 [Peniophora sp. CONT]|nr:hypothetical protein PENSPDRAFT_689918 [Peniophora sp. CONT]